MTTFIVIYSLILLVIIAFCFYMFYKQMSVREKTSIELRHFKGSFLSWKVSFLIITALVLVVLSFVSPFLFTRKAINEDFNFSQTGQIGDTIGGLMNPFIALAGVVVTGLAFYIQYKANIQQRELFELEQAQNKQDLQEQINHQNHQLKVQQFESQFYEMLSLHRDNLKEMKINGYNFLESKDNPLERYEKDTEGRKLFVVMQTEFELILKIYRDKKKVIDKEGFYKCYTVFFSGVEEFAKYYPDEHEFIKILREARGQHEHPEKKGIVTNENRKRFSPYGDLYFNYKPFSGHSSRFSHYYRHLYLTVKSVANSSIITDYEEKMRFLKILRAQLSNNEQMFLFYNWVSGFGANWENSRNSFFTEYCMIHNLPSHNLFNDPYIKNQVDFLKTKEVIFRKGKMFEKDE